MNPLDKEIGTEEASQEEQEQYEQAYDSAMRSLHGGEVAKRTLQRVINAETPQEGVAEAVFVLLRRTEQQMEGLDDAVKIQIAEDLVEEVLSLLVESDRMKESEITDEMIGEIVSTLYTRYMEDAEGRGAIDTEQVKRDVDQGAKLMGVPQGVNAMSNQEVESRGLMDV